MLVAIITMITVMTTANAATETIKAGEATPVEPYIAGVKFSTKTTSEGKYLYCLEMAKKTTQNTTLKLTGVRNAGIAYIIQNGYPTKSFTGDKEKDYYITQTAIWWYLDETTGSVNLGERFKSTGSDPHNLRGYVKKLVEEAVKANEKGYVTASVKADIENDKLYIDGDSYISKVIKVTTNAKNYTVSLDNATSGAKIIGEKTGKEATTFNSGENFIVKVPASEVKSNNISIKVNITANGKIYKAYEYTPSDSNMQKVTPGDIILEDEKVSTSLNLSLSSTKVSIIKLDATNDKPVEKAILVLKDSKGTEIEKWPTTKEAKVIYNLSAGTYTVSELEAPEGYEKSTEVVTFKISGDADEKTIKFYNAPKEKTVVKIKKIDAETGAPLKDAVLVVTDSKGKEIRFTTTEDTYVITDLEYGKYTLREESAPEGYEKSEEVVNFELDKNHTSYQI